MTMIKTVTDLRENLVDNFELLKRDKMGLKESSEMTKVAAKILQSAKLEMDYKKLTKSKKVIKFLK